MSAPQLENGYTRIANELLEAIMVAGLSRRELLVVMAIIRKTYGYKDKAAGVSKKTDDMSLSQIAKLTGLARSHCCSAVNQLVKAKILTKAPGKFGQVLGVNKQIGAWGVTKTVTPAKRVTKAVTVTESVTPLLPKQEQQCYRNSNKGVTETVNTIDNSNRYSQKITPKDTGNGATPAAPANGKSNGKAPGKTVATFEAYAAAYRDRYGVEPERNASVNGKLSQFINRVGSDHAPAIAAYFVGLNVKWYVTKGHSVGCLLNDAEQLSTQWKTGQSVTATKADQIDKTQSNLDLANYLKGEVAAGRL